MQYICIYLLFLLPLVNICLRPVQCLLPWSSFSEPCNSNARSHIKCDTLWQSKSHSNSKFKFVRGQKNYNILTGQTKPQTQNVDPTLNSDNVRMMLPLLRHMRGLITTHRSCAPRVLSHEGGGWEVWHERGNSSTKWPSLRECNFWQLQRVFRLIET